MEHPSRTAPPERSEERARVPLPTDRLKFDGQKAALKAIAVASNNGQRGVTADEMAPRMGVAAATAGLNNAFFVEAGLIERERKGVYKPKEPTLEYSRKAGFNETVSAQMRAPSSLRTMTKTV
jgi:hypothetical protein